jgi:hypothetical protein
MPPRLQICNFLFPGDKQIADMSISCAFFAAERILLQKRKHGKADIRKEFEIADLQFLLCLWL